MVFVWVCIGRSKYRNMSMHVSPPRTQCPPPPRLQPKAPWLDPQCWWARTPPQRRLLATLCGSTGCILLRDVSPVEVPVPGYPEWYLAHFPVCCPDNGPFRLVHGSPTAAISHGRLHLPYRSPVHWRAVKGGGLLPTVGSGLVHASWRPTKRGSRRGCRGVVCTWARRKLMY